jgi:F-type H+-transporting ATPase subunit epsilon
MQSLLTLKISLPFKIYAELKNVSRITAESNEGSFGILPHRLDCIAALVPGVLLYETEAGKINYLAVDEGILVKTGTDVFVSVRNAIGGVSLGKLQESVEKQFKNLDKQEKDVRFSIEKLEGGFIRSLQKFHRV